MLSYVGIAVIVLIVVGVAFLSQRFGEQVAEQKEAESSTVVTGNSIPAQEAFKLVQANKQNKKFVILDVRTPEEFAAEHIDKARNLNFDDANFKAEVNKLHKNQKYLVYCKTGGKSGKTVNMMREIGIREVYHLAGGLAKWSDANLPTQK